MSNITASLDDLAAKLPRVEFKAKRKPAEYYNQNMQSLRGGRKFVLRTYIHPYQNVVELVLIEYGKELGEEFYIAKRKAEKDEPESFRKALKSLERKAKCKLYYVLLISTDGEYL